MECDRRFIRDYVATTIAFALVLATTLAFTAMVLNGGFRVPLLDSEDETIAKAGLLGLEVVLEEYGFVEDLCVGAVRVVRPVSYYVLMVDSGVYSLTIASTLLETPDGASYRPVDAEDIVINPRGNGGGECRASVEGAKLYTPFYGKAESLRGQGRVVVVFPVDASKLGDYTLRLFLAGERRVVVNIGFRGSEVSGITIELPG